MLIYNYEQVFLGRFLFGMPHRLAGLRVADAALYLFRGALWIM